MSRLRTAFALTFISAALVASPAYAVAIDGTAADDYLQGTVDADVIHGRAGDDQIEDLAESSDDLFGDEGVDVLIAGFGADRIEGGDGDDTLFTAEGPLAATPTRKWSDGARDVVSCGPGNDTVHLGDDDIADASCESIYRDGVLAPGPEADTQAPLLAGVTVPEVTTTREVMLTFNARDAGGSGLEGLRLATEDGNWQPWVQFSAMRNFTLSQGVGPKGIFVQVRDAAGNESNSVYVRTTYRTDQPAPQPEMRGPIVLESIEIPATTTTREIEFVQNYHGGEGCISLRTSTEDGNWGGWVTCKTRNRTAASAGYGAKGLFVQLKGSNGTLSEVKYVRYQHVKATDTPNTPAPTKDAQAPVLTSATVTAPKFPNRTATVNITATDDIGVTQVRLANEDGSWGAWQVGKAAVQHNVSAGKGYKGVFVQVRDASGKESTVIYARFTVA